MASEMVNENTVWSEQRWLLADIMDRYGLSEDKAAEVSATIANAFEDRIIEQGWELIDNLIYFYGALNGNED